MTTDTEDTKQRSALGFLLTGSFLEKAFLLILTAVLSGVAVPQVVKSIDAAREGRAAVARAQAKLFDDISETVLTYETLALDVSWFGTRAARNQELQRKAFERYSERMVELTARWRIQASRAQTLASPQVAEKIAGLLHKVFIRQDTPMNTMWSSCGAKCDWEQLHVENERMLGEANMLIAEVAKDLGLMRASAYATGT